MHTRTLSAFSASWKAAYGLDYFVGKKDRSNLGRLLKDLPRDLADDLPRLFGLYLADKDRFLVGRRHDLTYFCTGGFVNKYRAAKAGNGFRFSTREDLR